MAAVAMACGVVFVLGRTAFAKREYLEKFQTVFGLTENVTGRCVFCHTIKGSEKAGKGNLGPYGKDVQHALNQNEQLKANVELVAVLLFKKDSDGDGITNMEEFALSTFPGDPKSMPAKEALDAYRKKVAALDAAKQKDAGSKPPVPAKPTGPGKTPKK